MYHWYLTITRTHVSHSNPHFQTLLARPSFLAYCGGRYACLTNPVVSSTGAEESNVGHPPAGHPPFPIEGLHKMHLF